MTPLFHVLSDWHVIRVLTNMITYLFMLGAYFYCMKPFKIRRSTVIFSSVILLLPFSETFLTHMQMGNTYMWHVILILLAYGMFLRLSQPWEEEGRAGFSPAFCIWLFAWSAACRGCGTCWHCRHHCALRWEFIF